MKIKFIADALPINYTTPVAILGLRDKATRDGQEYTLLGQSEKNHSFAQRSWYGIRALTKTILTLGLVLFLSEKTRSDWKSFFKGKKVIAIYNSSPFLQKKFPADRGDALAQYCVGSMYEEGLWVFQSLTEAAKYYLLAANQGNPQAQANLGSMYEQGLGVEQSNETALKYYQSAAKEGNKKAMENLSRLQNK